MSLTPEQQRRLVLDMHVAVGGAQEISKWLTWLADIGYGVDFTHNPPPPCTPHQLAEVYAERDSEDVEDWVAVLLDGNSAGGWYGNGRDEP